MQIQTHYACMKEVIWIRVYVVFLKCICILLVLSILLVFVTFKNVFVFILTGILKAHLMDVVILQ